MPPQLGGVGRQLSWNRRVARKPGLRAGEVAAQLGTNQTVEFRPRPRSNQKCEHGSSAGAPSPRVTFQVAGPGVPSMPRACARERMRVLPVLCLSLSYVEREKGKKAAVRSRQVTRGCGLSQFAISAAGPVGFAGRWLHVKKKIWLAASQLRFTAGDPQLIPRSNQPRQNQKNN